VVGTKTLHTSPPILAWGSAWVRLVTKPIVHTPGAILQEHDLRKGMAVLRAESFHELLHRRVNGVDAGNAQDETLGQPAEVLAEHVAREPAEAVISTSTISVLRIFQSICRLRTDSGR